LSPETEWDESHKGSSKNMEKEHEINPFNSPREEGLEWSTLEGFLSVKGPIAEPHDEVTRSDINHWCEVMHDSNPLYTDEEYASKSKYGTIIAPSCMAQAWALDTFWSAMVKFRDGITPESENPESQVIAVLNPAGYTSVMATKQTIEVFGTIKLGDKIYSQKSLGRISNYDHFSRQGIGRYVDLIYTFTNQDGEVISKLVFTLLKYKPPITSARIYKG